MTNVFDTMAPFDGGKDFRLSPVAREILAVAHDTFQYEFLGDDVKTLIEIHYELFFDLLRIREYMIQVNHVRPFEWPDEFALTDERIIEVVFSERAAYFIDTYSDMIDDVSLGLYVSQSDYFNHIDLSDVWILFSGVCKIMQVGDSYL